MKRAFGLLAITAVAAVSLGACGGDVADARAQWTVHVRTDAPVPQLGDRVLVELLRADGTSACSGCRRLFGLVGPDAWPFSFGIPDPGLGALRLRVRLFRSDRSDDGGAPKAGVPIDVVAALPATNGSALDVSLVLRTACAGVAADPVAGLTCDPTTGGLVAQMLASGDGGEGPLPGSSDLARDVPCPRAPVDGMTCIPGGLFVRGDASIRHLPNTPIPSVPERLVRLSPFAMDRDEMTVGAYRVLVDRGMAHPPLDRTAEPYCTWSPTPEGREDLPVNCLAMTYAREACEARGLRLPTEAEWEFAARARTEARRYPWGNDPDACEHAIVGKGRLLTTEGGTGEESYACRKETSPGLFEPAGPRPVTASLDVTPQGVRGLGGNVTEWVLDAGNTYDGVCGEGPRVLVDPVCTVPLEDTILVRGGNWSDRAIGALSALRHAYFVENPNVWTGFRCVDAMR